MTPLLDLKSLTGKANNDLLQRVSRDLASYYMALPLAHEDGRVTVVTAHPDNRAAFQMLARLLKSPATGLSGGQQQRLCLARAIAIKPEILLCDESTASLDPIAAQGIEGLLMELRGHYTLVIVTHNIAQARRLADYVMFMWLGELVEYGPAEEFFNNPKLPLTQDYLARRIG